MNNVKFYRRLPDGRVQVKTVRCTQHTKRFMYRNDQRKQRRILPDVILMVARMTKQGWSRKRLWTHMKAPA